MKKSLASIILSYPLQCMIPCPESYTTGSTKGLFQYDQAAEQLKKWSSFWTRHGHQHRAHLLVSGMVCAAIQYRLKPNSMNKMIFGLDTSTHFSGDWEETKVSWKIDCFRGTHWHYRDEQKWDKAPNVGKKFQKPVHKGEFHSWSISDTYNRLINNYTKQ